MKESLEGLDKIERAFVLFYASWCPFSQKFLPIFEEFSKTKECIKIESDDDICGKYSIDYYPTVVEFKKGKACRRIDARPGVGLNKRQLEELGK
jgi:thiol-disulfide isomerase/thioredoxin